MICHIFTCKTNYVIHWIVIYLVDSVIHLSSNPGLIYFIMFYDN